MSTSHPIPGRPSSWGHFSGRMRQAMTGRIAVATSWTASAMLLAQVIRLVGNLIMTRLLLPEMFGVMSIVLSVQITLGMMLDIGLRTALIQSQRGEDPVLLNTAWTIQIIRCLAIFAITVLIAAGIPLATHLGLIPAGSAWTAPELPLVLVVASLGVVIHGFDSTNIITAERKLALKRVVLIQITGQLAGLVLMVVLGILTGSIWALVASGLCSVVVVTTLSHVALPGIRNRLMWDKGARAELSRYSAWILISSGTFVLASNADRFLLGGLVDTTTLGLYAIALNLAMILTGLGSAFLNSVVMPALSEVSREQDKVKFRKKYFQLRLPWDIGFLLVAGALLALGPMVVQILYDDRYLPAGPMLQILALSLILFRYNFTNITYAAAGELSAMATINIVRLVSIVVMLIAGYYWFGFTGALFAVSLHMLPMVPVMTFFNRKLDINSLRFELLVLLALPVGYAGGWVVLQILESLIGQ